MAVDVRINGADYPDVPAIDVPKTNNGGTATFYDCSGDTAFDAQVLNGRTYHNANGQRTGTMAYHGLTALNIADKSMVYLDSGYYLSVQAQISPEEQAKIVSENIKSGVTMLGVVGSLKAGVDFDDMFNHSNPQSISSSPSADNTDKVCYGFDAGFNLDLTGFLHVASYGFRNAHIRSLVAPDLESVGDSGFEGNSRLGGTLTLPALTSAGQSAFATPSYDGELSEVILPVIPELSLNMFMGQGYLGDVWLGYDGVVGLPQYTYGTTFEGCARNSFVGDPYLKIHVPPTRLSAYQADSRWTAEINSLVGAGVDVSIVGDYE